MLIASTKLRSKMTLRYPAPALLNSSPIKKRKLEALPTAGQSRSQLSNQDLVKRSNLAKTFKLNELCKVVNDISNFDLPGEMGSRALDHLILSCLQQWDHQPMTKFFQVTDYSLKNRLRLLFDGVFKAWEDYGALL
jgi:hypothetical protein